MKAVSSICIVAFGFVAFAGAVTRSASAARIQRLALVRTSIRSSLAGVQLLDGDIVFRRTDGLRGRIATASDVAAGYSHAGLVSLRGGKRTVIHADPEGKGDAHGRVMRTTLDDFVGDSTVVRVAVYRLRLRDDARTVRAMRWAGGHALRGTPFDNAFNLADSSEMYCTELVWRAYRAAGLEIATPTRREARSLFLIDSILLLSSIERSPLLYQVFVSPQR